jgi:glutathione S-transferase
MSAETFVLFGIPGSPYVRSVQLVLAEKRAPCRFHALQAGEHKSAEHLARHPFGRVPALQHGEFVLYETQAILRYVNAILPEPPLEPKDARRAARMNQIVGICDWYLFPKVTAVIGFQRIIAPVLLKQATDENACAAAVPSARTCVSELDRLLGTQPFMAGEHLTLADLMLVPQLEFLSWTPEVRTLLEGTRLAAWLDRMRERPSLRAVPVPEMFRSAA